jgi:BirA family biotin operon repressor/biotin-[acetyl-CoA-carboxylase] ligase
MVKDIYIEPYEAEGLALLEYLRRRGGQWQSMEAIRRALGIRPEEVNRQIALLQQVGHEIESMPAYGYRLKGVIRELRSELIEYNLGTQRVGKKVLVYESTESTNDIAWLHATEAGYDGLAVFAEQQRAGRGRLGRTWLAGKGSSVLASVLLQDVGAIPGQALTLLAGLAAAKAVEDTFNLKVQIKWPNDVYLSGRKLAGTLVESRVISGTVAYVLGIGINCQQSVDDFPVVLRETAVSLKQVLGRDVDRVELARQLLRQLDRWLILLGEKQFDLLHDEWLTRCDEIGQKITLMINGRRFTGRVIDVSAEQGLLLRLDNGAIQIFEGARSSVVR